MKYLNTTYTSVLFQHCILWPIFDSDKLRVEYGQFETFWENINFLLLFLLRVEYC